MDYRHLLAVTLVTPALLLTACHASTPTADPPRVAPSATSPTPARETPQHFIRRWARAEKAMENTGHTREYLALSHSCSACRKLAGTIRSYYAAGGFVRWGGWQIRRIVRVTRQDFLYDLNVASRVTRYKTASGAPLEQLPGGPATHQVTLRSAGTGWQVARLVRLGS